MKDNVFLDTNILVYLHSITETKKRDASISVLRNYTCATSTQVLNEFSNVFIKKYKTSNETIKKSIINISKSCSVQLITERVICFALDINNRYGYSYYDCLIISSALESGCKTLFSEDMSNRQIIENKLEIVNPYKEL